MTGLQEPRTQLSKRFPVVLVQEGLPALPQKDEERALELLVAGCRVVLEVLHEPWQHHVVAVREVAEAAAQQLLAPHTYFRVVVGGQVQDVVEDVGVVDGEAAVDVLVEPGPVHQYGASHQVVADVLFDAQCLVLHQAFQALEALHARKLLKLLTRPTLPCRTIII